MIYSYLCICQVRIVSYFTFLSLNHRRVTSTCALYEPRRHPRFWALFQHVRAGQRHIRIYGHQVTEECHWWGVLSLPSQPLSSVCLLNLWNLDHCLSLGAMWERLAHHYVLRVCTENSGFRTEPSHWSHHYGRRVG